MGGFGLMTNDDERGGGGKNAENLMTSYVNDPYTEAATVDITVGDTAIYQVSNFTYLGTIR